MINVLLLWWNFLFRPVIVFVCLLSPINRSNVVETVADRHHSIDPRPPFQCLFVIFYPVVFSRTVCSGQRPLSEHGPRPVGLHFYFRQAEIVRIFQSATHFETCGKKNYQINYITRLGFVSDLHLYFHRKSDFLVTPEMISFRSKMNDHRMQALCV